MQYQEKTFALKELNGISAKQITEHLKLYSGYVKNVNGLIEDINALKTDSLKNARAISELVRRFAFEWNGMRMHEYYFEALGGDGTPNGSLLQSIENQYGSVDKWMQEFKTIGMMRGVGWVVLLLDPENKNLYNIWINEHEIGHLAGGKILIAMDVWEHAYLLDYLPSDRKDYIENYFKNLDWTVVERRYSETQK